MSEDNYVRWQYACVRILRGLYNNPDGMRTSSLKDFVRKEETVFVDLSTLRGYEFIKAIEYLEAKQMVRASYPGNATEWIHITDKGKDVLDSSEMELEKNLAEFGIKNNKT
jgi:hypothetical protein